MKREKYLEKLVMWKNDPHRKQRAKADAEIKSALDAILDKIGEGAHDAV